MTDTMTSVDVAERIVEDLLAQSSLPIPTSGAVLNPNMWTRAYRDTLMERMPAFIANAHRSWNVTTGVPDGDDQIVGAYFCQAMGSDTFSFSESQQRTMGAWWKANRVRYFGWFGQHEAIDGSDSESESEHMDDPDGAFADDEPIEIGTLVRILPNPRTYAEGTVYFTPDVTRGEVISGYGYLPTSGDQRVRRLDGEDGGTREQSVGRQYLRKMPEPEMVPVADLAAARAETAAARAETAEWQERYRAFRSTIATESDHLSDLALEAAIESEFCGEYERLCRRIARDNAYVLLKEREVDLRATWRETYRVTVTRTELFTGRSGDDDANLDLAQEIASNADTLSECDLISLLRENGSHEFDDDSVFEVEVETD